MGNWKRLILAYAIVLSPFLFCCGVPNAIFLAQFGRLPLGVGVKVSAIPTGTSAEEVRRRLGPPHARKVHDDGSEYWVYYCGALGGEIYSMSFDADGRLTGRASRID